MKVAYHLHHYLLLNYLDHGRLRLFIHALGGPTFFLSYYEYLYIYILLCWVFVYKSLLFFCSAGARFSNPLRRC